MPPQEIITKDSVSVSVDAVCYFRIFDPINSVLKVENSHYSTHMLVATSIRNVLAQLSLQEILLDKNSISGQIRKNLDEATKAWFF